MSDEGACQNADTRKKRDWKAINARRGLPELCSRYRWEQVQRVARLAGALGKPYGYQYILEQAMQGKLPGLRKELEAELRTKVDHETRYRVEWRDCYRKLDKLWACMLKAARDYGVAEDQAGRWVIEYLVENKKTGLKLRQRA